MLILKQFDVRLIRLKRDDIEMVRTWRNSAHVRDNMVYKEYITEEMQNAWFETINNSFNYYFIIEFDSKKVGVINAKNFQKEQGFGEGGIFIGDQTYEHSFAAVYASLCLLNFVFYLLKDINKSRIRILKDNFRAIQYNKLLGYEWVEDSEDGLNQIYELTRENFLTKGLKLNKAAAIFSNGSSEMELFGEESEINMQEINELL
ncbi:MAG: GNAT family N-acetyltransferase, partial [Bacteroidetes bacterium]|nr:GNAT family N-acetyltransferase [Bacteroidota bacterium]